MNKITLLLVFVLLMSLLFVSCQDRADVDVYNVLINNASHSQKNIDTSEYESFNMTGKRYDNTECPRVKTETILNKNYTLDYQYSVDSNIYSDNLDYYYDAVLDCQVAYFRTSGKLSQVHQNSTEGRIVSYDKAILNTDDYMLWIKEIVSKTFKIDINDYIASSRTYYKDQTTANSFVPSDTNTDNQVSFYFFEYSKYFGDYKSEDGIRIISHPDGSIKSMTYTESPYDIDFKVMIDEVKLNSTIEKAVTDICSPKKTLKNHTVNSIILNYYEGKPYLMCGVEIRIIDRDVGEYGCAVIFAIDFLT